MQKFSSIFIANLAEISLNLLQYMSPQEVDEEISEDHALSDRFVFSQVDNSVLITPVALPENFLNDIVSLMKLKNVINLSPRSVKYSVCDSIQQDKSLFEKVGLLIKNNPGIPLLSYAGTPEFFALVDALRKRGLKFSTPEIPQEKNRWTTGYFGSKSGFRQATSSLDASFHKLPKGIITSDKTEIMGTAHYFLNTAAGCVLKTNRGLAGAGLQIIRRKEALKNPEKFVENIITKHDYFQNGMIVVEEFIPPDTTVCGGAPNVELQIRNGRVEPLYVCSMRVTRGGVFQGVEFGNGAVSKKLTKNLIHCGKELGNYLLKFGYNGFFEIDFVAGIDKEIYPIESNTRRTGGTHAYELALRLLGKMALKNNYFVTNNRYFSTKLESRSYEKIKKDISHLLYPMGKKKQGVILTIISNLARGRLGYIVVGPNKQTTIRIEAALLKLLN